MEPQGSHLQLRPQGAGRRSSRAQRGPRGHSQCAMASASSRSPRSCGRSRGGPQRQRSRAATIPRRLGARAFPCGRNGPKPIREGGGTGLVPPTPTSYAPSTEREPQPRRTRLLSESSALWKCCSASVKEIGGRGAPGVPPNPAGRQGVRQTPTDP